MSTTLPEPLPWNLGGGNLAGTETGRDHLSHTLLAAFLTCPQKYAWNYVERIEPVRRPDALTLGKAYQLSIEHRDPAVGARSLRAEATISSQQDEDRVRVQEAIIVAASGLYLDYFVRPVSGSRTEPPQEDGLREFAYRVRLRNPFNGYLSRSFDLLGYADEIVDKGDHWLLIENKLVGQITETQVRRLPLDRQIQLASYGVWRATGKPVREVSYRFVRKPSIRQRQGDSVEDYTQRLLEDYATRPDFYLHEESWLRSTDDLVRTEAELWDWSRQLRAARRAPVWTRNTGQCSEFGGCPFIPLCLGEDAGGMFRRKSERTPALTHPEQMAAA
jgi:hypothetical protein